MDVYDDVVIEMIDLPTRDGATAPAVFSVPVGDGPFPAIAIGAEGTGPNTYIRRVAATLSHLGFAVIVPDYYRGSGPPEPDNYDDFETLMSYIGALDFTCAVHDLFDGIDYLQGLPTVDATASRAGVTARAARSRCSPRVSATTSRPRWCSSRASRRSTRTPPSSRSTPSTCCGTSRAPWPS